MSNQANGQAAEKIVGLSLNELGLSVKCPVKTGSILNAIKNAKRGKSHLESALYHVERQYGEFYSSGILADHALGCDGFFEANDGSVVSFDVTVDASKEESKLGIQRSVAGVRSACGLGRHIVVILNTSLSFQELTYDQKWEVADALLECVEDDRLVAYINL